MVDFSHLASWDIPNDAKPLVIDDIPGELITLFLLPAAESNKPYWNETLRQIEKRVRKGKGKIQINAEKIARERAVDKTLLGRYCLVGWTGVKEADGTDVEWTKENGIDFLEKLPGWLFDRVKAFCTDPENFVPAMIDDDLDDDEIEGEAEPKTLGND